MATGEEILSFLKKHKQEFAQRFSVRRIGLFGSYRRGTPGEQSDADILVEMERPTFDNYMDLKFFLEDSLKISVDLVLADSVKPRLRPVVSREVVYA